ncbi:hypothetical protein AVEN_215025-1 [Araneus ventricosus]|uniref:DUF4817 domain-containing protein n=1 Tax=Araneus ventricosus TaxID=182803 RepID=A0A4Y2G1S5_ARAVE|nr:hypothetical protein AVEN_3513-1 [Araneus ventricosus]GBM46520.1 hypothetical protein AVEN_227283-1 [Araneus ventricosus]GBM46573.1 hypothetical protein AVEN_143890-1 [Araneus ventricosus]GBM46579.1 hypothetical protein AVEN_215025-1 [Araneus ventricosus]
MVLSPPVACFTECLYKPWKLSADLEKSSLQTHNSTMSGIKTTRISCIMQMRMEHHTCSPKTTTIKRMFLLGCPLKLRVMAKFGINDYCEMVLIYGECGRKAKSAAKLYRERFPEGPNPTRQTILKVVKRLRETGCAPADLEFVDLLM